MKTITVALVILLASLTACTGTPVSSDQSSLTCTFQLPRCGIWIAATTEEAQARKVAGEEPDITFHAGDWVTCSDAVYLAGRDWPQQSVIDEVSFHSIHQ